MFMKCGRKQEYISSSLHIVLISGIPVKSHHNFPIIIRIWRSYAYGTKQKKRNRFRILARGAADGGRGGEAPEGNTASVSELPYTSGGLEKTLCSVL
jgi:hypothetical protein